MTRLAALALTCLALFAAYFLAFRPALMRWGATDDEVAQALPGDAQWPDATHLETRAITIQVPPRRVWPWLAQLGQDRGGFYSYEWLEGLAGAEIRNANRILPGMRERRVGDTLWMAPPDLYQGSGFAVFSWVEPGRALVVSTHVGHDPAQVGTWAFVLERRGPGETRFIVRGRSGRRDAPQRPAQWLFEKLVFEPMHFVMEHRMLIGLKERAEGATPDPRRDLAEAASWIVALLVAIVSALATLLRGSWRRAWALFVGAGLSLLVLPLERPPLELSLAAAAVLLAAVPWAILAGRRKRQG